MSLFINPVSSLDGFAKPTGGWQRATSVLTIVASTESGGKWVSAVLG